SVFIFYFFYMLFFFFSNLYYFFIIYVSSTFFYQRLSLSLFFLMIRRPPRSTLFPYTDALPICDARGGSYTSPLTHNRCRSTANLDRKSTRLNSSHLVISYAVFCLKKKKKKHKSKK